MKRMLHIVFVLLFVSGVVAFSQAPSPPKNLTANLGPFGGTILKWDSVSNAMGYVIYKSVDDSPFGRIAMVRMPGFLDWYVSPDHIYHYYVTAINMLYESGPSDTAIFAFGHHPPMSGQGVIAGRITDDVSGLPIKGVVVQFFQPGKLWTERTHTDSGGVYWAALDTGRYIVRADKFGYFGEWFNNVRRIDSAFIVPLHQDTFMANFGLQPIPPPVIITISGTITSDSSTGPPLPNTLVAVLRPHRWLRALEIVSGMFGGFPYERFNIPGIGMLHGVVWLGKTDSIGKYNAHVFAGLPYIVFAFKPGYIPEFYNNKFTPFDADRIFLTHDTSGIDFALKSNPIAIHSISGMVVDSSATGIPSNVMLYRKTIYGRLPIRFTMTDSVGNYEFHDLVNGVFYVKAIPVDGYAPAWYNKTNCGVRNWHFADSIHIGGNVVGGPTDINVCVIPSPRMGFARIAGNVDRNPGNLLAVTPEQGVTVYAVSVVTNQVIGYDVTESNGSYSIENLPEGTYTVTVDKEGFASMSSPIVTVDSSSNYEVTSASITINPDILSVQEIKHVLPNAYRLAQNFPNPFNPSTQIRFDLPKTSIVNLKVYSLIGQEVSVLIDQSLDAGTYDAKWNGTTTNGNPASSGIYFIKLVATPEDGSIASFSEVRKMVLMK